MSSLLIRLGKQDESMKAQGAHLSDHERRLLKVEKVIRALPPRSSTPIREARAFLRAALSDYLPHPAADLLRDGVACGHSERTLRRAAKSMGIVSLRGRSATADPHRAYWRLLAALAEDSLT